MEGLTLSSSTDRRDDRARVHAVIEAAWHGLLRVLVRLRKVLPRQGEEGPSSLPSTGGGAQATGVGRIIGHIRQSFQWTDLALLLGVVIAVGVAFGRPDAQDAPVAGQEATVTVQEGSVAGQGAPVNAEATARISSPVRTPRAFVAVTGKSLRGRVGSDIPLAVRVSGDRGRPVVNRSIVWRVLDGPGGELESLALSTDPQGVVWNTLRLPQETGQITVVATAEGTDLPEVRFEVTAVPANR